MAKCCQGCTESADALLVFHFIDTTFYKAGEQPGGGATAISVCDVRRGWGRGEVWGGEVLILLFKTLTTKTVKNATGESSNPLTIYQKINTTLTLLISTSCRWC